MLFIVCGNDNFQGRSQVCVCPGIHTIIMLIPNYYMLANLFIFISAYNKFTHLSVKVKCFA